MTILDGSSYGDRHFSPCGHSDSYNRRNNEIYIQIQYQASANNKNLTQYKSGA